MTIQRRAIAGYAGMLLATTALFLWICDAGGSASPSPSLREANVPSAAHNNTFQHLLVALVLVIVSAKALGALFAYLRSPPVIGEIVAGILLGPSFFGALFPELSAQLLPTSIGPGLSMLAQIGVVLYMFFVGLEVDFSVLQKRGHTAVAISHASIVVPFLFGALLSLVLYPRLSADTVPFSHFALFCGAAMSVTAFPVLARILSDRNQHTSQLGILALTCAAIDDISAWCLLALVVSIVGGNPNGAALTFGLTITYLVVMWRVVQPMVARFVAEYETRRGEVDKTLQTLVFVAVLLSALVTEWIGIHAVFGAFAIGVIIPTQSRLAKQLSRVLPDFVIVLFLPAFFAYTGLRTQLGLVSSSAHWLLCLAVLATACAGKFGGTFVAARVTGMGRRDAAALGILMNTRGLMELIVLNIGLDLKVISPTLFAMMVIMAVVTTFATTPILHVIQHFGIRAGVSNPKSALSTTYAD